jgi:hypothetical protein
MPDDPKAAAMIAVKNVSRGPQALDGGGMLAPGETDNAADSEHTAAQIDAGLLIAMPAAKAAAKDKE